MTVIFPAAPPQNTRRIHINLEAPSAASDRWRVWNLLVARCDLTAGGVPTHFVSSVRETEMVRLTGLPLHRVLGAVSSLARDGHLLREAQKAGRPYRYVLIGDPRRRSEPRPAEAPAPIHLLHGA